MKATGIVRKLDDLGRIVLPREIRGTLELDAGTPIEIFTENDGYIILRKYRVKNACAICESCREDNIRLKGKCFCTSCIKALEKARKEKVR